MKILTLSALFLAAISAANASETAKTDTNTDASVLSKSEIAAILDIKTKTNIAFNPVVLSPFNTDSITLIAKKQSKRNQSGRTLENITAVSGE